MTDHLQAARELVLLRAGGRCEHCGRRSRALEMSHRVARGMGGTKRSGEEAHSAVNLCALCRNCHRHVESFPFWAYSMGLKVRRGFPPAEVPVQMHDGPWMLHEDGIRSVHKPASL